MLNFNSREEISNCNSEIIIAISFCSSTVGGITKGQLSTSIFLRFVCLTPSSKLKKYRFVFISCNKNIGFALIAFNEQIRWFKVYKLFLSTKKHFAIALPFGTSLNTIRISFLQLDKVNR